MYKLEIGDICLPVVDTCVACVLDVLDGVLFCLYSYVFIFI